MPEVLDVCDAELLQNSYSLIGVKTAVVAARITSTPKLVA